MGRLKKSLCVDSLFAVFFGLSLVGISFALSGCPTPDRLPEPATNNGLSSAENKLDTLTDKRVSRIAASATVASEAVGRIEPNNTDKAIAKSELAIIRAMAGEPVAAPINAIKKVGYAVTLAGVILSAIPMIGDEPWFKPAVGGLLGLLVLILVITVILNARKNKLNNCEGVKPKVDEPPSDTPTN